MSPRSDTLRAIGPSTHRLSNAGKPFPLGTTQGLGLSPTTPQKLAGILNDPPRQDPLANHDSPEANEAAAPPEDPPAVLPKFQGFLVNPQTGLKV